MKTLSSARPRPSMLIAMPRLLSEAKESAEVNCEPRSQFQISGWPKRNAASSAVRQKPVSIVLESSQLSTKRLNQSITATRYGKPPRIGNVSNIGAPDVVGPEDFHAAQQVRVDLVTRCRAAQVRFGIVGFDAQDAHQPLDALAVYLQLDGHFAASEKRTLQIQLVELAEQTQVLRALRPRLVVVGRARHSQQLALLLNAEAPMSGTDPLPFVVSR